MTSGPVPSTPQCSFGAGPQRAYNPADHKRRRNHQRTTLSHVRVCVKSCGTNSHYPGLESVKPGKMGGGGRQRGQKSWMTSGCRKDRVCAPAGRGDRKQWDTA